jgi:hypothetical protein
MVKAIAVLVIYLKFSFIVIDNPQPGISMNKKHLAKNVLRLYKKKNKPRLQ